MLGPGLAHTPPSSNQPQHVVQEQWAPLMYHRAAHTAFSQLELLWGFNSASSFPPPSLPAKAFPGKSALWKKTWENKQCVPGQIPGPKGCVALGSVGLCAAVKGEQQHPASRGSLRMGLTPSPSSLLGQLPLPQVKWCRKRRGEGGKPGWRRLGAQHNAPFTGNPPERTPTRSAFCSWSWNTTSQSDSGPGTGLRGLIFLLL